MCYIKNIEENIWQGKMKGLTAPKPPTDPSLGGGWLLSLVGRHVGWDLTYLGSLVLVLVKVGEVR